MRAHVLLPQILIVGLIATAPIAAGCASAGPQSTTATPGRLPAERTDTTPMMSMEVIVEGSVQVLSEHGEGEGTWRNLRPGPQNFYQGDTLATGRSGSSATLTFAGGTMFRLGELTQVRNTGLSRGGDRLRFELSTGRVETQVGGAVVSFELTTPSADVGDATGHWAAEHRDGSLLVAVRDGSVSVQPRSGARRQAVVVRAGQQVAVSSEAVSAPESLDSDTASRLFASGQ